VPELPIAIVGVAGEDLSKAARRAVEEAELVVGGSRLLEAWAPEAPKRRVLAGGLEPVLDEIDAEPGTVCVLASGDPGFFGIVRAMAERFGPDALDVHPAPSSVSLAFARLGLPWDDAVVVSAHGRPLAEAVRAAAVAAKAAVLTSPDNPPEALAAPLLDLGAAVDRVAVCARLGEPDETVETVDLEELGRRRWDPRSVVVLLREPAVGAEPVLAWGRNPSQFEHRAGMITKAEVRAVALGKLGVPATGVLWDVGAGSGSVAIECAGLAPELRVLALERRADDAARARANAGAHRVSVEVIEGEAPGALGSMPDPDRAFVGGGGLPVLDAVLARLRPDGRIVATFAAFDRAAAALDRLGHLVQVGVSRAERLPGGGARLAAENPVFVAWGPEE
jgi:precorrin-6Y C5,15-methyltransferase (decarboxylating)